MSNVNDTNSPSCIKAPKLKLDLGEMEHRAVLHLGSHEKNDWTDDSMFLNKKQTQKNWDGQQ